MATTAVVHDHFVLLVSREEFENPPTWLSENFTIIEGGTHAGGSSRNKLIVFKDGTYLELFNWIKEPVEFLDWADKKPGLIDYAITTLSSVTPEDNFDIVQHNLSTIPADMDLGVSYSKPLAGGRKRADGKEVKWKNSRPSFRTTAATPDQKLFPDKRIDVPFFCHDVTQRTVRVPFDNEKLTTHPCGAVGIDGVEVLVPETHFDQYQLLYSAVLDTTKALQPKIGNQDRSVCFEIGVPNPLTSEPAYVVVRSPQQMAVTDSFPGSGEASPSRLQDQTFLEERGIGIRSLTIRKAGITHDSLGTSSLASDGIGSTIKLRG